MSDIGDDFNALRKLRQVKRASNRQSSAEALTAAGIAFESKNFNIHLVVSAPRGLIDFWPGTGLWTPRGTDVKRRGVLRLISYIKKQKEKP